MTILLFHNKRFLQQSSGFPIRQKWCFLCHPSCLIHWTNVYSTTQPYSKYTIVSLPPWSTHTSTKVLPMGANYAPLPSYALFLENTTFFFAEVHEQEIKYKLKEILTEDDQIAELESQILQGNHQVSRRKPEELKKKFYCNVKHGFLWYPLTRKWCTAFKALWCSPARSIYNSSFLFGMTNNDTVTDDTPG